MYKVDSLNFTEEEGNLRPVSAANSTVPSGMCLFGLGATGASERLGVVGLKFQVQVACGLSARPLFSLRRGIRG